MLKVGQTVRIVPSYVLVLSSTCPPQSSLNLQPQNGWRERPQPAGHVHGEPRLTRALSAHEMLPNSFLPLCFRI